MPKNTEQVVRSDSLPQIFPFRIPVIWVVGQYKVGKSSFAALLDPVKPGQPTRTLITDLEGSHAILRQQVSMDVADIRQMTIDKYGQGYTFKDLFVTWRDFVTDIEPGKYTVLGVDPASDLFSGCYQWTRANPGYFGKVEEAYRGMKGTKFAYGDAKLLWKQIITGLENKFQTVVLVSHTKDVYANDEKTGALTARGEDFTEVATLVLWLAREETSNGLKYWAKVQFSRLTHLVWSEDGDTRQASMLPVRLEPKPGQSYKALIKSYLEAPQPSYGELDTITGYDPSIILMSEEEKAAREIELINARREVLIVERKNEIVNNLVAHHGFKDRSEVARAIHQLGLGDDAQDLIKLDEVEQRLIDSKSEQLVQEA